MHDSTAVGRLKKLGEEEGWEVEVGRLREVRKRGRGSQGEYGENIAQNLAEMGPS